MKELRFGVIGMSDGNGHPYSWSAICNGYDAGAMEECGFPVIPRYLEQQDWPSARLGSVRVTHVWTQDVARSEHIARAAKIEHVVPAPEDMIGRVDGLLLARDDAQNHLRFARPFLEAGLPVYVDKPVALSLSGLDDLMNLAQTEVQLFSCSALRYAAELIPDDITLSKIGDLVSVRAVTPKKWDTYAVHVIDPVLAMLPDTGEPVSVETSRIDAERITLNVEWASGVRTSFSSLGDTEQGLSIHLTGTRGEVTLVPSDSFSAFKGALKAFRDSVTSGRVTAPLALNRRIVQLIELGRSD